MLVFDHVMTIGAVVRAVANAAKPVRQHKHHTDIIGINTPILLIERLRIRRAVSARDVTELSVGKLTIRGMSLSKDLLGGRIAYLDSGVMMTANSSLVPFTS